MAGLLQRVLDHLAGEGGADADGAGPAVATNVNICWAICKAGGTYDEQASVKAAQALVSALGVDKKLTFAPPLMSNHNKRLAIVMKNHMASRPDHHQERTRQGHRHQLKTA